VAFALIALYSRTPVIAGLVPAIHHATNPGVRIRDRMDRRNKSGDDKERFPD
jgi:hypothetical protein